MTKRFLELLNQIKRITGLTLGIGYVTAGVIIGNVIFALLWFALATILTVEEYGEISYILAISVLGVTFSVFGLHTTMLTFIPKEIKGLKNQINSLILISTISIAFFTLLITQSISVFVLIIGIVFFQMSTAECMACKKYKEFAILIIGTRISQVVLTLIFYYIDGIELALIGYGIAHLPFSYRYFSSLRFFKFRFNDVFSRIKFVMHSFSLQIANNIPWYDKFLIAPLFGFFVLGQYQIGIQFLLFAGMIPQFLFQYLLPEKAAGTSHTRLEYTGIIVTIILVVIIVVAMPFILQNFFPKYVESVLSTQIILIGAIPLAINYLVGAKFLGLEQSKYVFYGVLFYVGVLIISIFTLGLAYSTVGLAISIVLALSSHTSFLLLMDHFVIAKMAKNSK